MSETEAWNAGAHEWAERIRSGMSGRVHAHDASLYELLPPPRGLTLDVGCGEGRLTRELTTRGYDVAGFDASEMLIEEARTADPSGRYEVAQIDALPVADGAAELAVCVNVLPHIHDLAAAAAELARVLAPGGTLLIGTIHPIAHAGTHDEESGELRIRDYYDREPERRAPRRAHRPPPAPNDRGVPADVARRRLRARRPARGARPERLDAALPRPAAHAQLVIDDERRLPAAEGERLREPVERDAEPDQLLQRARKRLARPVERLDAGTQSSRWAFTLPKRTRFSSTTSTPITLFSICAFPARPSIPSRHATPLRPSRPSPSSISCASPAASTTMSNGPELARSVVFVEM